MNFAQVRRTGNAATGPVLAMHRAIAMLGLDGVRHAATGLRAWPGPLNESAAGALQRLIARQARWPVIWRALHPAGYDPEVVFLIAALQNLGWLVRAVPLPRGSAADPPADAAGAVAKPDEPDEQGMSEQAASFAVLGIDIEALAPR